MQIQINHQHQTYSADTMQGVSLAITLRPNSPQNPSCYYAEAPENQVIRAGDFVGSVAEGGTVNYTRLCLTPHGNGTHTECYGHISPSPDATLDRCLQEFMFVAELVSLPTTTRENGDNVVLLKDLQKAIQHQTKAIIIRTLPNNSDKKTNAYSGTNPPYLEESTGQWLAAQGIEHLLLDLPSVDREEDAGRLAVHRGFWQYPAATRTQATITELIFVPDTLPDGLYWLHLQVPRLATDAAPSQPMVYPLKPVQ